MLIREEASDRKRFDQKLPFLSPYHASSVTSTIIRHFFLQQAIP